MSLPPDSILIPRLFEEHGYAPVLVSPDALYPGFHLERYTHTLPEIEHGPIRDVTVVLRLQPCQFTRTTGRHTERRVVQANSIGIIPHGLTARWSWEAPVDVTHFRMDDGWIDGIVQTSGGKAEIMGRLDVVDTQMQRLLLSLHSEVENGCPGGRLFGEGVATALAAHLLVHYAAHPLQVKDYVKGLGKKDLRRCLDFIDDNLSSDLRLADLAACVSLSPFYFARLFRQSTGQSPHRYVLAQRIRRAKYLLARPGLSVGEVAAAVGFYDYSHFARHFKAVAGLSPKDFLRQSRR